MSTDKKKSKARRFVHVNGFGDDTKYLEFVQGKAFAVKPDGARKRLHSYTLEFALEAVGSGVWKELTVAARIPRSDFLRALAMTKKQYAKAIRDLANFDKKASRK